MYEKKLQGVNSQLSILKCTYRVIISTVHYTQNTMNILCKILTKTINTMEEPVVNPIIIVIISSLQT